MEKYAAWLQRSKDSPLVISINEKAFAKSPVKNVKVIMQLIGPHMERWRSFQIRAYLRTICLFLDNLRGRSLPLLEHLRVAKWSNKSRVHRELQWESLGAFTFEAPRLQEVELIGVVVGFSSPLFHHLRALHLRNSSFSGMEPQEAKNFIHHILQQAPRLKQLRIEGSWVPRLLHRSLPTNPPTSEEPLIHSHLADLTLDLPLREYDAIIFSVRFPALRSFRSKNRSRLTLPSRHLPLLAKTSPFPSLAQIYLYGDPNNPQFNLYLPDALSTLASVEDLTLNKFDMTQVANTLPTLSRSCPQLRRLILLSCMNVDLDQVRSLVERRLRVDGMTGLRELRIYGGLKDDPPELETARAWLREHVEGVSLHPR